MPSIDAIVLVAVAGLMLSLSPGPSMLYVASHSIARDRRAGLMSAAGLATGGMIHALAAAGGLTIVLAHSKTAYEVIASVGAVYLVHLGIQMIRTRNEPLGSTATTHHGGLRRIFCQGVVVEVLNPKTALFFLAFLPQFVNQEAGSFMLQVLVLGMLVPLTAVPSDLMVAFTAGSVARKLSASQAARCWLNTLGGLCLVVLAIRLFLSGLGA